MTLISCAWMRLNTEAAKLGKAAIVCTYNDENGCNLCSELWKRGACPCADEVIY